MTKEIDEGSLLLWLKSKTGFTYRYAGQCRTGVAYCFLVNSYFPRLISPDKVVVSPHAEPECRSNYALLSKALNKLGFSRVEIQFDEVIKGNRTACLNALRELQVHLEGAPLSPFHTPGPPPKAATCRPTIVEPRSPYRTPQAVQVLPLAANVEPRAASPPRQRATEADVVAIAQGYFPDDIVEEVYRPFEADFPVRANDADVGRFERDRAHYRLSPVESLGPSEGSEDALEPFRTLRPILEERLIEKQESTSLSMCIRARPPVLRANRSRSEQQRRQGLRWALDGNVIKVAKARGSAPPPEFTFEHVFDPHATAEDVYSTCCRGAVLDCWMGANVLLTAYGGRNTGKTYTVGGGSTQRGLVDCVARDLFALVAKSKENGCVCNVAVSYFEVYNERVLDLLQTVGTDKDRRRLPQLLLPEDGPESGAGEEVVQRAVQSAEGVLRLHRKGTRYRHTARGNHHWPESRSHAILTLTITKSDLVDISGLTNTVSQLYIMDAAGTQPAMSPLGSEGEAIDSSLDVPEIRSRRQPHVVEVVEELSIRKSLSAFSRCLQALGERQRTGHQVRDVPYRDSKLTRVLAPLLARRCRAVVVGTVDLEDFPGTLATLTLGRTAGQATGPKVLPREYSAAEPDALQLELRRLKAELKRLRKFNEEHAQRNRELDLERQAQTAALREMEERLRREQLASEKAIALMEAKLESQAEAHREEVTQMGSQLREAQDALRAAEERVAREGELEAEIAALKRALQEKETAVELARRTTEVNAKHIVELEQQLERQERALKAGREGGRPGTGGRAPALELQAANDKLLRIAEALAKERQLREAMQRMIESQHKPSRWGNLLGKKPKEPQWQQHIRPIAPYRRQVAEEYDLLHLMSEMPEDVDPPPEEPPPPAPQPPPKAAKRRPERARRGDLGPLLEV
eukprot:EG_transcript_1634